MRILYGVAGEGMGHAMRSQVVADHLRDRGHAVQFICSAGRALDYLRAKNDRVVCVPGFNMVVDRNRVQPTPTLLYNAIKHALTPVWWHAWCAANITPPDIVISDFDAWSARYARLFQKKLLAIDNIHFINRCSHPEEFIVRNKEAAAVAYSTTQQVVPDADAYFVTTFALAPICQTKTTLHLPIVRKEIVDAASSRGDHLLAYFNDRADWRAIIAALQGFPGPVRAYGSKEHGAAGNVELRPFSDRGLAADLASCRGVVAGAGFTLVSESIYLKKPMLAVPFHGSFEQVLNGLYLEKLGFGRWTPLLTPEALRRFVVDLPALGQRLQSYRHDCNAGLFNALDRSIDG